MEYSEKSSLETSYIFEWHPVLRDKDGNITKDSAPSTETGDLLVSGITGDGHGNIDNFVFISQWTGHNWTNCDSEIITAWAKMPEPYGKLKAY